MRSEAATATEWQEAADADRDATFFQTPSWFALASIFVPRYQVVARRYRLDSSRSVILPFLMRKGAGLLGVSAMNGNFAGGYGGWLAEEPLDRADLAALAKALRREFHVMEIRPNPWQAHGGLPDGWGTVEKDMTHAIDLRVGIDGVRARYSKGHRYNIRHAERLGVRVSVATDASDWRAYGELYQDSLQRWGERATTEHPPELLDGLATLAGPSVRLWLAHVEGQPACGAVVLRHGRHAAYWLGASAKQHLGAHASNLLQDRIIADAAASGAEIYDMNPSGGLAGVVKFKEGFGAAAVPCPLYRRRSGRARFLGKVMAHRRRPR